MTNDWETIQLAKKSGDGMCKIFVGSSSEQLDLAKWISECVEKIDGCSALLWSDQFESGDITYLKILDLAQQCDGGIFVYAADDIGIIRGEEHGVPRGNVVFERGVFAGRFGQSAQMRVALLRVDGAEIETDSKGLTYISYDSRKPNTSRNAIEKFLKNIVKAKVEPEDRNEVVTCQNLSKQELFIKGTNLISAAGSRVVIAAKTPVFLVGPRPYDQNEKYDYEQNQFEKYWELIRNASDSGLKITVIASLPEIKSEISRTRVPDYRDFVTKNIIELLKISESPRSNVTVRWYDGRSPSTYLVADNHALVWWKGDDAEVVSVEERGGQLNGTLALMETRAFKTLSQEQVLNKLRSRSKR